jgi:hypothetical protein
MVAVKRCVADWLAPLKRGYVCASTSRTLLAYLK